jgi:hypothetical protein
MTTRTVRGGPPHQEDINHATYENASPNIGRCHRCRPRNACPAALGTGKGAGIHWDWGTGLPRTGGRRSPAASCCLPCTGGRGKLSRGGRPTTGSVWKSPGHRWRILRAAALPLETPSPPLAPLVKILSVDDALPCPVDREGLFPSRPPPHPARLSQAKPVWQSRCRPRGIVRHREMHDL